MRMYLMMQLKKSISEPIAFNFFHGVILLISLLPIRSFGQLIVAGQNISGGFDKFPTFNSNYIKSNKIKSITFDIIDKKDFQIAVDNGLIQHFDFDNEGRLTRYYYTNVQKTIVKQFQKPDIYKRKKKIASGGTYFKNETVYDTISYRFFYNESNKIKLKRFNEKEFYESTYYDYDKDGNLIRELRCRETNVSGDPSVFQCGLQTILSEEKFEYEKTGSLQIKKKCLNDEGRIFKEAIINFSESKKILSVNENFTATWISQQTLFKYNEKDQLIEKKYSSDTNGSMSTTDIFEYDEKGNILTEFQYKNGVLTNELSYLFDENTQLVKSFLNRDHIQKSIRITKVFYK